MKSIPWSYRPYAPFFHDPGNPYICRVVPGETEIYFEWLKDEKSDEYRVYIRPKEANSSFSFVGRTKDDNYTIGNLAVDKDYEFYVETDGGKSRVRLAHTGKSIGTVVNYLHPYDDCYSFSGQYLCSPSLVKHPDGYLLSSMDLFGHGSPQNLTLIFRSDDNGETWHYVSELMPCFWGKLFVHKNELYMLACSTEYGDLIIGKSNDGGKTFSEYSVLLRGSCKTDQPGVHKNPQNIVKYNGRIYETLEWGAWEQGYHAAMVMSCDENAELLNAKNWHFSKPLKYDPRWNGVAVGESAGTIEGTLVVAPDGQLYNIMRYDTLRTIPNYGIALAYKVDTENPNSPLTYSHAIDFPCNLSKFTIKYDALSKKYYSLATRITDEKNVFARTLLSLMVSDDLRKWSVARDIIDLRNNDPQKVGVQYVDFEFDHEDIIFLSRTAINSAHNYHDSNYQTFHRIRNFRNS